MKISLVRGRTKCKLQYLLLYICPDLFYFRAFLLLYILKTFRYFILYKPFGVICQFSPEGEKKTLKDCFDFPSTVYSVGRLDTDSEGLIIITDDNNLKHQLLEPKFKHTKTYYVQVEGEVTDQAINELKSGVEISIKGKKYITKPAQAHKLNESVVSLLPERNPPVRFRKTVPDSWISLSISEGKNRQVRRMTAKTGFPTLRLIRQSIEKLTIQGLQPGDVKELSKSEIYKLCNIR